MRVEIHSDLVEEIVAGAVALGVEVVVGGAIAVAECLDLDGAVVVSAAALVHPKVKMLSFKMNQYQQYTLYL